MRRTTTAVSTVEERWRRRKHERSGVGGGRSELCLCAWPLGMPYAIRHVLGLSAQSLIRSTRVCFLFLMTTVMPYHPGPVCLSCHGPRSLGPRRPSSGPSDGISARLPKRPSAKCGGLGVHQPRSRFRRRAISRHAASIMIIRSVAARSCTHPRPAMVMSISTPS